MSRLTSFPSTLPAYEYPKSRRVRVGADNVQVMLESAPRVFNTGDVIEMSEYEYDLIDAAAFTSGALIDEGEVAPVPGDAEVQIIDIPLTLADVDDGAVTSVTPGFAGTVHSARFLVTTPVTTGSKATTLGFDISGEPLGRAEVQTITVDATGGTFTVTYSGQTTAALAFDITAANLQAALEGLSTIGSGNVTVTGGPGDAGGNTPYSVTFAGALAGTDVAAMTTNAGSLTGGAGTAAVAVGTAGSALTIGLTSANCATEGSAVASSGTLVAAQADFGATDSIDINASSTTAFVEGAGVVQLVVVAS